MTSPKPHLSTILALGTKSSIHDHFGEYNLSLNHDTYINFEEFFLIVGITTLGTLVS
jgi:hypothetical protein